MASISELMNALSRGFAAVLADAGVKSAVVLLAAAIAARLLRRASAAVRHRVWSLGLSGALVMPMLSWMLPPMRLPVLPARAEQAGQLVATIPRQPSREVAATDSIARDVKDETREINAAPLPAHSFESNVAAANPSGETAATVDARVYLLGFWIAGLAIVLIPLVAGFAVNCRLLRKSRRLNQPRWLRLIAELSGRIGLKQTVAAFESPQPVIPMTWGLLRPMVLVPADWRGWPQERQRCVLLHELAHVKRRDVAYQIVGRLAAAVYWFNPLVWFAVRQLRVERELACDDCVLASGERATDYARELLTIARLYRLRPLAVGVAMAHSARLDQRVLRILDRARSRLPMSRRAARSLFVTAAVLVLGVAATSLVERSTTAVARERAAAVGEVSRANITVRGVVLTPGGEPAVGARVYVLDAAGSPFLPFLGNEKVRLLAVAQASNDGTFSLSYTEPEETDQQGVNQAALIHHTTRFVATADGYAIGLANNDDHRDAIRIQLAPPQALAGRLIDVEGRPVVGAKIHVKAIAQAGEPLDAWFARAKANSHPDEQMQFAMSKAGERRPRPVPFPSKERVALTATPLAANATTDRDGHFSIPNIGPDRLVAFEVAAPMIAKTFVKMVSHRGPDVYDVLPDPGLHDRMIHGAEATIVVGPAAAVKGVVTDAETGHTIPNCRVEVTQVAGEFFTADGFAQTTTDESGRYLLGHLPLDPPDSRGYRLRFTPPVEAPYFSTEFEVRLGGDNFETTFDVRLPRARLITGRITDKATGQPVRALVGYLPTYDNKGASAYPNFQSQMRTVAFGDFRWNEADGSFRVPAINGRGALCVTAEQTAAYALAGHADRIEGLQGKGDKFGLFHLWDASMCNEFREVNLTERDPDPTIDVELRPFSRRTVRLVDGQGRPVVGCLATGQMPDVAFAARQNMSDYPPLDSAETGVIGLEVESPRVLAFYQPESDLGATAVVRQDDREPISVTMQPCGRIEGRVVDAVGKPAPGRQVSASGIAPVELPKPEHNFGPASFRVFTETVKTDAEGRFEIRRGVLPGIGYRVMVRENVLAREQPVGDERTAPPSKKDTPVVEPGQTVNMGDLGIPAAATKQTADETAKD